MFKQDHRTTTERGYGWRWQQARKPFLSANPLCVACKGKGKITPATVVDHIIPHRGNQELFWDQANWQALCKSCHDLKTIIEDGSSGAQSHPEWLPKPACRTLLVTGPPGAGKTTYCKANATQHDTVIDLDDCFYQVCGVHGHTADRKYLAQALRLRNKLIANLTTKRHGTAYIIVGSPSRKETDWWLAKLNAQHVLIDPGQSLCEQRTQGRRQQAVRDWYTKAKTNHWHRPHHARPTVGADGWPIED